MPREWGKVNKMGLMGVLAGLGIILNIVALKSPILGLILSVFWLVWLVCQLRKGWGWDLAIAILGAALIILGSVFFYIFNLGPTAVSLMVVILTILDFEAGRRNEQIKINISRGWPRMNAKFVILTLYFVFYILSFVLLFQYQSTEAIRTPWEVLPKIFLVIYFALSGLLLIYATNSRKDNNYKIITVLIAAHFLLSLMVATIIYKIGFGFDPFVHRAAEKALVDLGYIQPKPFFYMGQYVLVAFGANIFQSSVTWIDKLIVPLMAVLTLPGLAISSLLKLTKTERGAKIAWPFLIGAVTPLFFYTVPQSLANLLLLILILISWSVILQKEKIIWPHWLILAAIFFIHPLSAIPGAIWLVWGALINSKKIWKYLGGMAAAISLPVMFVIWQKVSGGFGLDFAWENLGRLTESFGAEFLNYLPFYSIYHLVYLYRFNILFLILILAALGIYFLLRSTKNKAGVFHYLAVLGILILNLLALGLINFRAIIDYEQVEFIRRLAQIILIVSCPLLLTGAYLVIKKIMMLKGGQLMIIFFGALWLTFSLYLNYPRDDAFLKGRSYAVSEDDLKSVRWIDNDAQGKDYIVLSNQSVAAAALQEFGFKKYFTSNQQLTINNQQLFYYPIPTSSPLYEIYLDIIYNGVTREKIQKAQALTGAEKVYLVINSYWLDAKKRAEEAKLLTNNRENIGGKVWVFGW